VYAHHRGSEWHVNAREQIGSLGSSGGPWAIPWPCIHEFLAVTTNARLFRSSNSLAAAIDQVEAWMESPSLRLLGELQGHWSELKSVLVAGKFTGSSIHDARIAALCREHGVTELWTADRDFSRASGIRTRNPLI
jgi:hypothetical protein